MKQTRTLLSGGAVLAFSGIWVLPLLDTSEARYAEAAREMAAGGDWLVPHLMGSPHLTKPPLGYWLSALAMKVFGPQAWTARLPVALAFLGTVAIVAALGDRLWADRRGGHWAGWALLFSALPAGASNILTTDTLLAFFETASVGCAWMSLAAAGSASGRGWALGSYAALALAFLTKGPPGLLVSLAIAIFAVRHRGNFPVRRLLTPWGPVLFACVALPWFIAVALQVPGTLSFWLQKEMAERFLGDSGRNMPFLLYIPILLAGSLPAGALLPAAGRLLWKEARAARPAPAELLFWWATIPLAVLCVARSRLPLYILPIFPPLAIAVGRWLALRFMDRAAPARAALAILSGAALLWLGARLLTVRSSAIQEFLDLHPDPRPAAGAILSDAGRERILPRTFVTAPSAGLPGYGLAFYLREPLPRIDLRPLGDILENGAAPAATPACEVLDRPVQPGTRQYFTIAAEKALRLEERIGSARGRWIHREGGIWVFRRED